MENAGVLSAKDLCLSGVPQDSVIDPLHFLYFGVSAFADDVKMVFPRSHSSRFLSSRSSAWAWAGEYDLPINPKKCSCLTVGDLPPLSQPQTATTKCSRSPTLETCWFSSTRPSPRPPTAERLRIQQSVCCSWSEDPSVNYQRQRLPRSTMP